MKNSADRKAADVPELNAREMFALRCLNAAVNLYGILTVDECVKLYNHYAKGQPAPVSDEMTVDEFKELAVHLPVAVEDFLNNADLTPEQENDFPVPWFTPWIGVKNFPDLIVHYDLAEIESVPATEVGGEEKVEIEEDILATRAEFEKIDLNLLPEEDFFDYEEIFFAEETKESRALVKFLQEEFGLDEDDAEGDVKDILSNARMYGASITQALEYVRDTANWRPQGQDQFMRLVKALSPALSATRLWRGRGRSTSELCKLGLVEKYEAESIPTDIFDGDEESEASRMINGWRSDCDDDYDDEEEGEPILPEDIPLSVYNGPIDFKFVKDPAKREAKLAVYEDVQQVVDDFYTDYFIDECPSDSSETTDARFGLAKENGGRFPPEFSLFLSEFTLFLDDEAKETPCQKVLANRDAFDEIDKRAATYYENFRFTCLEILAVKTGVGMKCRDLLTDEDLFLMEKSFSQGDVKGVLMFASIAPMEDVYISVGNILPLPRENARAIIDRALDQAGIPTERPIRLSFDQQRKLAAETIKAYVALRGT
jgi:hypothetical protein